MIMGVAGLLISAARSVNPQLAPADLCPVNEALIPTTTVLLLDATDPWSELRRAAVAREVAAITDSVPRFTRVALHVVQASRRAADGVGDPIAELCNPGSPEQVVAAAADHGFAGRFSGLVTNPERARARFDSAFVRVLDDLVSLAGQAAPQDESPILETLRAAMLGAWPEARRSIVLISDLYQNSDLCSFYGPPRCFDVQDRLADPAVGGTHDLRGAEVEILLLTPAGGEFVSREDLLRFWHRYFAQQGALITRVKRIEQ